MSKNSRKSAIRSLFAQGIVTTLLGMSLGCGGSSPAGPTPTPTPTPVTPSPVALSGVYTVTPGTNAVAPGGQLSVSWIASSGQRNDYIEFYRVGDSNTNALWWIGTGGAPSGTVTLAAPGAAGQYEFRYVLEDEVTDVARSSQVTVK